MRGFSVVVAGALLAALAGCNRAPTEAHAEKAWVRLPAVSGNPGAAYFTLTGGEKPDTLLQVYTPAALRSELHESMKGHEGMTTMAPIRDVPLPAKGTLAFAPGGKHVMLFSVGPAVKPGDKVPLAIALASGKTLAVEAKVVGPADPVPAD